MESRDNQRVSDEDRGFQLYVEEMIRNLSDLYPERLNTEERIEEFIGLLRQNIEIYNSVTDQNLSGNLEKFFPQSESGMSDGEDIPIDGNFRENSVANNYNESQESYVRSLLEDDGHGEGRYSDRDEVAR